MFSSRRTRQRAVLAALAIVGLLLGAASFNAHLLDSSLQAATYDTFITYAPGKISNQVTIVAIDDATIARYGRFPIPRQAYVDLLKALKPVQPWTIAFDVGFYDASPNPDQDRALAAAIHDAGNVILAMQGTGDAVVENGYLRYDGEEVPIRILRQAAAGLASVNIIPDADSRVRKAELQIQTPSGRHFALPLTATTRSMQAAHQIAGDETSIRRSGDTLVLPGRAGLADRVMPIDAAGLMPVYYASPPATDLGNAVQRDHPCSLKSEFCLVSLADVVAGKIPRDLLAHRTVFVGAHSLSAVPDDYPVPNSAGRKMFGVEIWANTAASIYTDRFPELREGFLVTVLEMLVATLGGILLVANFRLYGFLAAIGGLVLYGLARYLLFAVGTSGAVGDGPIAVASLGYLVPASFWWVVALGYLLVEEQRAVRRTQTTFGRFVTPSIARTIMDIEESGKLALGGEEKRVTVLFGDIRGFTTMSEGMAP
ncbi:MAG: CHASE2 domain-containing protein, partial [Candidatus Limnocylindria bacterium]